MGFPEKQVTPVLTPEPPMKGAFPWKKIWITFAIVGGIWVLFQIPIVILRYKTAKIFSEDLAIVSRPDADGNMEIKVVNRHDPEQVNPKPEHVFRFNTGQRERKIGFIVPKGYAQTEGYNKGIAFTKGNYGFTVEWNTMSDDGLKMFRRMDADDYYQKIRRQVADDAVLHKSGDTEIARKDAFWGIIQDKRLAREGYYKYFAFEWDQAIIVVMCMSLNDKPNFDKEEATFDQLVKSIWLDKKPEVTPSAVPQGTATTQQPR